jgi:hypothetical protein
VSLKGSLEARPAHRPWSPMSGVEGARILFALAEDPAPVIELVPYVLYLCQ